MRTLLLALAISAAAGPGQADPGRMVQIQFSNPGLIPSQWTLELHPDGSAHFKTVDGDLQRLADGRMEPPNLDRNVQLSTTFAQRVFRIAQRQKLFGKECESHLKVAFTGTKTLTYSGPDGHGSCAFNYSKDPDIQALSDSLVSVATTLIEGARLEVLRQHDPLGLDKETADLMEMASDGRAQQLGSIRDILQRLASDDDVLERVRKRARELLSQAND